MNFWGTPKVPHDKEKKKDKEKHKEQAVILKEIHAILETVQSHETQMDILKNNVKELIDKVSELEEDNEKKETEIRRLRSRITLAENQLGIQEDEE